MFIDELCPAIIGVCETWLRPSLNFRLRGYTMFREDRFPQAGGRLAVMVKDSLPSRLLPLTHFQAGVLEVLAVQVGLPGKWVTILVVYNPCCNVTQDELNHLY